MKKAILVGIALFASFALIAPDVLAQGGMFGEGKPAGGGEGTPRTSPAWIPWTTPGAPTPVPGGQGGPTSAPPSRPSPTPGSGSPTPTPAPGSGSPTPTPAAGSVTRADAGADQPLKPTLLFFLKSSSRIEIREGESDSDTPEKATWKWSREIFREKKIIRLAREFICVRVDVAKIDKYAPYLPVRTKKAPTVVLLDLKKRVLYRNSDPDLHWMVLARQMGMVLKMVEREVKLIAKSTMDTPLVRRAKARVVQIEMRNEYTKGFDLVIGMKWSLAEKRFRKVLERKTENEWSWNARSGLREIEAGKLYAEAQRAVRAGKISKAKDLLVKAMAIKEAVHYAKLARELAQKL